MSGLLGRVDDSLEDRKASAMPSPSRVIKNPKGKVIQVGQKLTIYKLYLSHYNQGKSKTQSVKLTVTDVGISEGTLWKIISEMEKTGAVKSPSKKRNRKNLGDKLDEDQKKTIRHIVHHLFLRNEQPTLNKIVQTVTENKTLPPISRSNLWRLLKTMGFVWERRDKNHRNFSKTKETISPSHTSECYSLSIEDLIIKEEYIEEAPIIRNDILEDTNRNNVVIKTEEISSTQTICDNINSDNTNFVNVIIKNEDIENELNSCNDNIANNTDNLTVKDEEIWGISTICKDEILNDSNGGNSEDIRRDDLIIKSEEIGYAQTIRNNTSDEVMAVFYL